jgi:hypothetical protein
MAQTVALALRRRAKDIEEATEALRPIFLS